MGLPTGAGLAEPVADHLRDFRVRRFGEAMHPGVDQRPEADLRLLVDLRLLHAKVLLRTARHPLGKLGIARLRLCKFGSA